jgi:hypothetical protein
VRSHGNTHSRGRIIIHFPDKCTSYLFPAESSTNNHPNPKINSFIAPFFFFTFEDFTRIIIIFSHLKRWQERDCDYTCNGFRPLMLAFRPSTGQQYRDHHPTLTRYIRPPSTFQLNILIGPSLAPLLNRNNNSNSFPHTRSDQVKNQCR